MLFIVILLASCCWVLIAFVERQSLRGPAVLFMLALIGSCAANAQDLWERDSEIPTSTVTLKVVPHADLVSIYEAAYGALPTPELLQGLSVRGLRQVCDIRNGEAVCALVHTCTIYVYLKPETVMDWPTVILGHEAAHCFGYSHQ